MSSARTLRTDDSVPLIRVSRADPCKRCGKGNNRCSRSGDGRLEVCYNLGGPGAEERTDSAGSTYYVYGSAKTRVQVYASGEAVGPRPERAEPEDLDAAYNALLGHLRLSRAHEEAMVARGFPAGAAYRLGYRTLPGRGRAEILARMEERFDVRALLSVPGFYSDGRGKLGLSALPGLLIPCRDPDGLIVALSVRPDEALDSCNKYLWVSSKNRGGPGPGAPAHVSLALMGKLGPFEMVVVTEGLLKADAVRELSGAPMVIGNPGAGNWKPSLPILRQLGAKTVRVAYDRDWRIKPDVAGALIKFARALKSEGYAVEVATWEDAAFKGLDDLLYAGKSPVFHAGAEADALLAKAETVAGGASVGDAARSADPESGRATAGLPDPDAILRKVEGLVDAGDFNSLIADDQLIGGMAAIEGSGAMSLIRSKVKSARNRGFSLGEFNNRIRSARGRIKRGREDAKRNLRTAPETAGGDKAIVLITTDEHATNEMAIEVLSRAPNLYVQGNALVKIARQPPSSKEKIKRPEGTPKIVPVASQSLRELSTALIDWRKTIISKGGEREEVRTHPPPWSIDAIMSRGEWPSFRPIEGIAEAPVLRPDGSLLDTPGWDEATNLFYEPSCDFPPIPSLPSLSDAREAVATLLEIVQDFPFAAIRTRDGKPLQEGDDPDGLDGETDLGRTHRVAWLAALLTPLARHAIGGPVPLFRLDANTAGSGKTNLCHIISLILCGRQMSVTSFPHEEAEQEKQLLSIALAGDPMVLFDNLPNGGSIGGAPLDAVLTSTTKNGRILGESRMAGDLPWNTVLYATGNNLSVVGDGLRRILPIRLETMEERPEARTDFKIPGNILDHVRERRAALVAAALTILRGFIAAGRPRPEPVVVSMDYSAWSELVRNALIWATGFDPAATREEMIVNDSEANDRVAIIEGLSELPNSDVGLTAAQILRTVSTPEGESKYERLRDAMAEWSTNREMPTPRVIGKRLKAIKGKVIEGHYVASTPYKGTQRWRVVAIRPGGSGGSSGSATTYAGEFTGKKDNSQDGENSSGFTGARDSGCGDSRHSHHSHHANGRERRSV